MATGILIWSIMRFHMWRDRQDVLKKLAFANVDRSKRILKRLQEKWAHPLLAYWSHREIAISWPSPLPLFAVGYLGLLCAPILAPLSLHPYCYHIGRLFTKSFVASSWFNLTLGPIVATEWGLVWVDGSMCALKKLRLVSINKVMIPFLSKKRKIKLCEIVSMIVQQLRKSS